MTPTSKYKFPVLPLKFSNAKLYILNLKILNFWVLITQFPITRENERFGSILTQNDLKLEIPSRVII